MVRRKPQKQPSPEFVKELAEAIGRVLIAASQIEHTLSMLIGDLLKLTRLQYRALVIPTSISNKISILRQLGKEYLSVTDRKKLAAILDEVKECADKRNELAHGFYGIKNSKFALITFSGDARFSGQPVAWTPANLLTLVTRMVVANSKIATVRPFFPERLKLPKNRQPIPASEHS
jgi:hypothetical protein